MISVTVQRAPADKQGPDISDPLITTEPVAVERGRNEIDANSTPRQIVTMDVVPIAGLRINRLIEVQDLTGPPWRGLLTAIHISCSQDGGAITDTMTLTVEREAV
jgi:hypothetical protein